MSDIQFINWPIFEIRNHSMHYMNMSKGKYHFQCGNFNYLHLLFIIINNYLRLTIHAIMLLCDTIWWIQILYPTYFKYIYTRIFINWKTSICMMHPSSSIGKPVYASIIYAINAERILYKCIHVWFTINKICDSYISSRNDHIDANVTWIIFFFIFQFFKLRIFW